MYPKSDKCELIDRVEPALQLQISDDVLKEFARSEDKYTVAESETTSVGSSDRLPASAAEERGTRFIRHKEPPIFETRDDSRSTRQPHQ